MKKGRHIITGLLLTCTILFSGILPGYLLSSQLLTIELLSEVESVEEKEIKEFVSDAKEKVKVKKHSQQNKLSASTAFDPIFTQNTVKEYPHSTPRFIKYCALLN